MTTFIAQTVVPSAPTTPGGGGMVSGIAIYGLVIAGFYFLFIAPQRKKQKEQEKMLAALETGDEVLTTGGIYGTITNVKADRFVVRIGDDTKVEIGKGFIQSATKKSAAS